jgi:hypothetical protein
MLSKEPSPELRKRIKKEISSFEILAQRIMENKWFAYALDNKFKLTRKKNDEPMLYVSGDSKKQWIIILFLSYLLRNLLALPRHIVKGAYFITNIINTLLLKGYRRHKLKKKFDYINSMMAKTLIR